MMPIYEYRCQACGKEWERRQTPAEMGEFGSSCEFCGARGARKFSSFNFSIERNPPPEAFDERHGGKYPLPREDAEIY